MNSQFFQNILFNIEKNFFNLKNIDKMNKHVFIFGLARSGTTILLNSLYSTNEYASTLYKDMPFVLSPNFSKIVNKKNILKKERLHGDGISYDIDSPEAFDEIFFNNENKFIKNELSNFIQLILLSKKLSQDLYWLL